MSSLTSPSVNKNTARFAPKVKQRERRGTSLKTSILPSTSRSTISTSLFTSKNITLADITSNTPNKEDFNSVTPLSTLPSSSSAPIPSIPVVRFEEPVTTNLPAPKSKTQPHTKKRRPSTTPLTTFSVPTKGEHTVGIAPPLSGDTLISASPPPPPPPTPITPTTHDSLIPDQPRKRKRSTMDTTQPLVTLDDISHDPARPELMQKPLSYFTDDLATGIVSRSFKNRKTKGDNATLTTTTTTTTTQAPTQEDQPTEPIQEHHDGLQESSTAPQVRLVNGEIVLDTSSLYIDTPLGRRQQVEYEVVEEDSTTKKINSRTHGKQHGSFGRRWTQKETDLFYRGIKQYGTDFEMIASIIPSRSRNEIKRMFTRQEKRHPMKITETIMQRANQDTAT
ncbi:hypothetical protein BC941DRAFT_408220 [Chlamydoabsidia padenii]|nr:hypothetical protein BC941DRAFT_408220 [Chlamydoabsidia padenii]